MEAIVDISHYDFDAVWRPSELEKKRLFEITKEILKSSYNEDQEFVTEFSEQLKQYTNIIGLGGDGFNLLFHNTEPIQSSDFLSLLLDLPDGKTGLAFFEMDDDGRGFDIEAKLRDELAEIVDKSGLEVCELDRAEDDDGRQYDDDDYEYDEDKDADVDDVNFEIEILTDENIWKNILENFGSMHKLTKEQNKLFNDFQQHYPAKKKKAITFSPGCLQISGMNKTKDIIHCSVITDGKGIKFSLVSDGNSFLINCSSEFNGYLENFLDTQTKGGFKFFKNVPSYF